MPVPSQTNLHYRQLAFELGDGDRGRMLSGWQCENPFVGSLLEAVRVSSSETDFRNYIYFDADELLAEKIRRLHLGLDGVTPPAALAGAGASPLISTFVAWLAETGVRRVHFIPPLYHTLSTGLARYGIELVPVAEHQTFESDFDLRLPDGSSVLLLSDPIWYAGVAVPEEVLAAVRNWQERTGSIVFVDGSLQYLPWVGARHEHTAALVPDLTIRLISPCKQLAVNGYRFAYLVAPSRHEAALAWIYANLFGPASAESVVFAHAAVEAVDAGVISAALTELAAARFNSIVEQGQVTPGPMPSLGYYAFVRLSSDLSIEGPTMDGRFFDQPRFVGYTKINLLSPAFPNVFDSTAVDYSILHGSS